ncbi:MAG: ATP-grasp domain-containing protein [Pseudomonadota bacterium]
MTQYNPVLIAGFSGRALAQSAHRAGFTPFVLDAYGDEDTKALAKESITDTSIIGSGFRAKTTMKALSQLRDATQTATPPLILGAGFEQSPKLIATLETQFDLKGCHADTVQRVKNPVTFFSTLHELGITHPQTLSQESCADREHNKTWLSKRIGGMGGLHIDYLDGDTPLAPKHYAQEHISGLSISATAIATSSHHAFAFTQSWINAAPDTPFRFGGVVCSVSPDTDLETRLVERDDIALERVRSQGPHLVRLHHGRR